MAAIGVDHIKVGIRACDVDSATLAALRAASAEGRRVIAVCMAEAPPATRDLAALAAVGVCGVMLDTIDKAGPRLTSLLHADALRAFVAEAHGLNLLAGLAGRLQVADIARLHDCGADYLGFRSALCAAGERRAGLDAQAFAELRAALCVAVLSISTNRNEVT